MSKTQDCNITAILKLAKGTVSKAYYVKKDRTVVITAIGDSVKIVDENDKPIHSGMSNKNVIVDLDKVARKKGFAGMAMASIPKIDVENETVSIHFLGRKDMNVKII
jgi:hypothetical protein